MPDLLPDLRTLAERARRDDAVVTPAPLDELHDRARRRRTRKQLVAGAVACTLLAALAAGLLLRPAEDAGLQVLDDPTTTAAPTTSLVTTTVTEAPTSTEAPATTEAPTTLPPSTTVPPTTAPSTTRPAPPTTPAPTAPPTMVPVTVSCGSIGFTPDSDDVASQIVGTNVTCQEAHAVVRASYDVVQETTTSYAVLGYKCTRAEEPGDGLTAFQHRCVAGDRVVTWRKT